MKQDLGSLTPDSFQHRLGSRFRVKPDAGRTLDAELIEVRPLGGGSKGRPAPFALLFRTARTAPLPQRIYEVEHDEMGSYELFLVPIGPDEKGMVYEAIFN